MSEYSSLFHQRSHSVPVGHSFANNDSTLNYGEHAPRIFTFRRHDLPPPPTINTTGPTILQFSANEGFPSLPTPKSLMSHLNTPSFTDENEARHTVSSDNFFCGSKSILSVFDYNRKDINYPIILNCKMDRGFFYNQTHWTCYRRNYFQVAASLVISGHSDQSQYGLQLDLDKPMQHIEHFYIRLSACASSNINSTALTSMNNAVLENHNVIRPVALIQMTAKRDKGPQREPPMLAVTPSDSVYNSNEDICVTYDRLQFKVATANNGKRKASQQYFRLIFQLVAQLSDGSQHIVSECYSLPLVVRGRSPGHYSSPSGQQRSRENKKKRSTDNSGITKDELFIEEKPPCSLSQYSTFSPTDEPKETATKPQNNSDPGLPYSQQQPMLSSSLLNASFSNFHTRSQSANDSAFYSRQQHTTNMKYHYKPVMNHNDMFDNNYNNAGGRSSSKMWQLQQRAEYYPEQPTSPNGLDYSNSNTTMYHPWPNMDDRFVKQEEQDTLPQSSSSR